MENIFKFIVFLTNKSDSMNTQLKLKSVLTRTKVFVLPLTSMKYFLIKLLGWQFNFIFSLTISLATKLDYFMLLGNVYNWSLSDKSKTPGSNEHQRWTKGAKCIWMRLVSQSVYWKHDLLLTPPNKRSKFCVL